MEISPWQIKANANESMYISNVVEQFAYEVFKVVNKFCPEYDIDIMYSMFYSDDVCKNAVKGDSTYFLVNNNVIAGILCEPLNHFEQKYTFFTAFSNLEMYNSTKF